MWTESSPIFRIFFERKVWTREKHCSIRRNARSKRAMVAKKLLAHSQDEHVPWTQREFVRARVVQVVLSLLEEHRGDRGTRSGRCYEIRCESVGLQVNRYRNETAISSKTKGNEKERKGKERERERERKKSERTVETVLWNARNTFLANVNNIFLVCYVNTSYIAVIIARCYYYFNVRSLYRHEVDILIKNVKTNHTF